MESGPTNSGPAAKPGAQLVPVPGSRPGQPVSFSPGGATSDPALAMSVSAIRAAPPPVRVRERRCSPTSPPAPRALPSPRTVRSTAAAEPSAIRPRPDALGTNTAAEGRGCDNEQRSRRLSQSMESKSARGLVSRDGTAGVRLRHDGCATEDAPPLELPSHHEGQVDDETGHQGGAEGASLVLLLRETPLTADRGRALLGGEGRELSHRSLRSGDTGGRPTAGGRTGPRRNP